MFCRFCRTAYMLTSPTMKPSLSVALWFITPGGEVCSTGRVLLVLEFWNREAREVAVSRGRGVNDCGRG